MNEAYEIFKSGEFYNITVLSDLGSTEICHMRCRFLHFEFPLLKVDCPVGGIQIFNTTAKEFIKVEVIA